MSDGAATPIEPSTGDDFKAQLKTAAEELKTELGRVIDQKLDELGAKIDNT